MPRIYIIKSATNSVNWLTTRSAIINAQMLFADGSRDFGAGVEPLVECPGCDRELPMALFHLDHIKSQARYAQRNLGLLGADRFVVLDNACRPVDNPRIQATGGYVRIATGSIYYPLEAIVQAIEVWRNDLRNLQFLCPICNSSKGDRDWQAWGKADYETRPLSRTYKEAGGMDD